MGSVVGGVEGCGTVADPVGESALVFPEPHVALYEASTMVDPSLTVTFTEVPVTLPGDSAPDTLTL